MIIKSLITARGGPKSVPKKIKSLYKVINEIRDSVCLGK